MCGLVFIASGNLSVKEERMFENMLIVDVIRGKDSTGVAVIKQHSHEIIKKLGVPHELLDSIKYQNAMKGGNMALIGHNRYATTGKVNTANAHPFETDNLIGVHNGTLENKHAIDKHHYYGTDSEALYNAIDAEGLTSAIGKVSGAYALIWFDKVHKTFNLLRNKERPLFIGTNKDGTTIFGASEVWMVRAIAMREGVDIDKIEMLPEDKHFCFSMPKDGDTAFSAPVIKDVKCAPPLAPAVTVVSTTTTRSTNVVLYRNLKGKAGSVINTYRNSVFLSFVCAEYPQYLFRVYFPSHEEARKYLNTEQTIYTRYLVTASNVMRYISCEIVLPPEEVEEENEEKNAITKEAFDSARIECAWCSDVIAFEDDWVKTPSGIHVCGSCRIDPDVKLYLKV